MSRRYNRVEPGVWLKPWDDDTRLTALYLLTCEHRNTEGLYRLPMSYVAEDLRWPLERVVPAMGNLLADGFAVYDVRASVVWIVKAFERQPPENKNISAAACRRLAELPSTPLIGMFLDAAREVSKAFAEVVDERFPTLVEKGSSTVVDERFPDVVDDPLALAQALTPQNSTLHRGPRASVNVVPIGEGFGDFGEAC